MELLTYSIIDSPYLSAEIGLCYNDWKEIAQSGSNDEAVKTVSRRPYVIRQFQKYSTEDLIKTAGYLCDSPEVETREDAIEWLVWHIAWNIAEENIDNTTITSEPNIETLLEQVSDETVLKELVQWLPNDTLIDYVASAQREYDLLYDEENDTYDVITIDDVIDELGYDGTLRAFIAYMTTDDLNEFCQDCYRNFDLDATEE